MTKQDLIDNRWRVYVNYGASIPLPDHLDDFLTMVSNDISGVTDVDFPLPQPVASTLMARIYFVCTSLPATPRQNIVVMWSDVEPYFKLTTEEVS